jgi:hypothetical protein
MNQHLSNHFNDWRVLSIRFRLSSAQHIQTKWINLLLEQSTKCVYLYIMFFFYMVQNVIWKYLVFPHLAGIQWPLNKSHTVLLWAVFREWQETTTTTIQQCNPCILSQFKHTINMLLPLYAHTQQVELFFHFVGRCLHKADKTLTFDLCK